MSLSICIPTYGHITAETFLSVINFLGTGPGPVTFDTAMGVYVHTSRNALVKRFLATDNTHLLFLDSDIMFPKDAIAKLLAHKVPIVAAPYRSRSGQQITVKQWNKDGKLYNMDQLLDYAFGCAAVATGFMLIERSVFDIVPAPWFFHETDELCDDLGEDTGFCLKANEYGVPVLCDPTIKLGHVGKYIY